MTVIMHLPSVLRKMTGGQAKVPVEAATLEEAVRELCRRHPDLARHVLDKDGNVRTFVRLFVDQQDAQSLEGVKTRLQEGQTIRIVPAIAGGQRRVHK